MIPLPKEELGVADLLGCYRGLFFAIEVKVGKNQQTMYQKKFAAQVKHVGGAFAVVRSMEEAEAFFIDLVGKREDQFAV